MNELFNSKEEAINFIINLNKTFFLNQKEHIKKYYKIRGIHEKVLSSMINYIDSGKLPVEEYFSKVANDYKKESGNIMFSLDNRIHDDEIIFNELFIYKNHHKIPSLTEIYIAKNKFKDKEKVKMLYAMKNSIVGLFKVINFDNINGYVTYQDVFTHKKYKIIDISMSSLGNVYEKQEIYIYNRIINYDGILFGTGLPCIFTNQNKKFKQFIKHHKYNKCSDFTRCIMLYNIAKDNTNTVNILNYPQ